MRDVSNILTGLAAIALGAILILWVVPAQTVPAIFASVPSGFYPNFTSGLLILSGLGLLIAGLFNRAPPISAIAVFRTTIRFAVALVLLVGAMALTPLIGFLPAGAVICLVTLLLMRETRWPLIAAISIAAPLFVWGGFELLLGRPLP